MPLYNLACSKALPAKARAAVATAITDTHCAVTDAPPEFVNVVFMDGYGLKKGTDIAVIGGVRSGGNRNAELIERLRSSLHRAISTAAKLDMNRVSIELIGVKASWVMEGGKVLPEPGAEDDWLSN